MQLHEAIRESSPLVDDFIMHLTNNTVRFATCDCRSFFNLFEGSKLKSTCENTFSFGAFQQCLLVWIIQIPILDEVCNCIYVSSRHFLDCLRQIQWQEPDSGNSLVVETRFSIDILVFQVFFERRADKHKVLRIVIAIVA